MTARRQYPARLPALALLAAVWLLAPGTAAAGGDAAPTPVSILDDQAFTARLGPALDRLYDLDLAAAEAELSALAALHPEHPAGPLLGALADWWRVQLDTEDTSHDATLEARIEEVLARADERLDADSDDPDGLFFRAAAIALRGRLASLRGRWIPAAYDGGRALRLVRRLAGSQPDNRDLLFGLGAYDYCADVVPDRYPIFKPLVPFFPRGDRERGLAELEEVRDRGRFARTEAAWLLAQFHYQFERDRGGTLEQLDWLRERHPGNALFHAFEGRTHVRFDDCARGGVVYRQVLERAEAGATGYNDVRAVEAHYMLGRCALENERYRDATPHLNEAARLAAERPDSPYGALAHLRLGMAADALGDRAAAVRHYRTALALTDGAEAHERARRYLREPYEGL